MCTCVRVCVVEWSLVSVRLGFKSIFEYPPVVTVGRRGWTPPETLQGIGESRCRRDLPSGPLPGRK